VKGLDTEYLKKIIKVEKSRMSVLADINNIGDYFFDDPKLDMEKLVFKKSTKELCKLALEKVADKLEINDDWESVEKMFELLKEVVAENEGLSNGDVFWPVRYALTGADQSPSPNELLWVLGKDVSLKRLKNVLELFKL
jgi:glutamyl-tRNA synthetase